MVESKQIELNSDNIFFTNLKNCVKEIHNKSNKLIPQGCFKNNIFRSKSKKLSFERKKLASPYLFYAMNRGISEVIIENLVNFKLGFIKHHQEWNTVDLETHKGNLYLNVDCNRTIETELLKMQLWFTNLSNLNQLKLSEIGYLNEPRIYATMISSPHTLFILGGQTFQSMSSACEMLSQENKLVRICNLNTPQISITGLYIYPDSIYVLSGDRKGRERLNLIQCQKWENIEVIKSYSRLFGAIIQISEDNVLIFGGQQSNKRFIKFNLTTKLFSNLKIAAPRHSFFCTRPRIYNGKIYLASTQIGSDVDEENITKIQIIIDTLEYKKRFLFKHSKETPNKFNKSF